MSHPYEALSPDLVLDGVARVGLAPDGHLLALNSYENRVYQVGIEDDTPIVTKFYRPARWSDAAILEEHAFAARLAAEEIPVVPPLEHDGATLHQAGHHRLAVYPCYGGRAPELDDYELQKQLGRLVARIHLEGEVARFEHRPGIDIDSYGTDSVNYLLDNAGKLPFVVFPTCDSCSWADASNARCEAFLKTASVCVIDCG